MEYDYIECGDCLELMKEIPDKSIDLILCDLPYGTTACKWDNVIPFEPLWEQYNRIIKDNGAIVLFGSEPFSTELRHRNLKMFKYDWIWEKEQGANFMLCKYQPYKVHEIISVFSKNRHNYYPQMTEGKPYISGKGNSGEITNCVTKIQTKNNGTRYPRSIQKFTTDKSKCSLHPTQKPVALLEYLIKTYTNEGEIVLDNCIGSGSTCVACVNTNRHYIGFEKEPKYYDIACKRIEEVERVKTMSKENCCDKIIPTKSVHIENMNEAQLEQEIAKSNRKLERLQKTMNANLGGDTQDVGLIPLNQINGYNDKNKNSEEAKRKSDKQITSTVNKAVAYTKAKADYDAEKKRNKALNEALNTVKVTGKTAKQIKDEKLAKIAKNSTMKWEKSTQKGQFGNVTIRKSGTYEIRTGAMSHIYKNGEQIGITNKLKDAIAFVELHNKRGENIG